MAETAMTEHLLGSLLKDDEESRKPTAAAAGAAVAAPEAGAQPAPTSGVPAQQAAVTTAPPAGTQTPVRTPSKDGAATGAGGAPVFGTWHYSQRSDGPPIIEWRPNHLGENTPASTASSKAETPGKPLVDRIQDDFPRTPSPVYVGMEADTRKTPDHPPNAYFQDVPSNAPLYSPSPSMGHHYTDSPAPAHFQQGANGQYNVVYHIANPQFPQPQFATAGAGGPGAAPVAFDGPNGVQYAVQYVAAAPAQFQSYSPQYGQYASAPAQFAGANGTPQYSSPQFATPAGATGGAAGGSPQFVVAGQSYATSPPPYDPAVQQYSTGSTTFTPVAQYAQGTGSPVAVAGGSPTSPGGVRQAYYPAPAAAAAPQGGGQGQPVHVVPYVAYIPVSQQGAAPNVVYAATQQGMIPMYIDESGYYNYGYEGSPSGFGSPDARPKRNRKERPTEHPPRSKLMEEFRTMKTRRWELSDLVGNIEEFARDQEGSRLIQRKLEGPQCSNEDRELVFSEVIGDALSLMTDVFGNYVIQKMFEFGLPHHRKALTQVLKGNVLSLSLQTYGCRVIQKALEFIDEEDQKMMATELEGHVLRCVLDQNGNHVIQKCIERIPPQNVRFIVNAFIGNVLNLAVHAYGCRVIQRILEYCEGHTDVISPILDEILTNTLQLVRDQYGNYVVQHVLINGKPLYQYAIIEKLRGEIMELSHHKFASNVVEKMFKYCSEEDRDGMLADLMTIRPGGLSPLHTMMKDQYANYVVQCVIDHADNKQRRAIVEHIKPHIATLRRYTYGKHIINRIEKLTLPSGK